MEVKTKDRIRRHLRKMEVSLTSKELEWLEKIEVVNDLVKKHGKGDQCISAIIDHVPTRNGETISQRQARTYIADAMYVFGIESIEQKEWVKNWVTEFIMEDIIAMRKKGDAKSLNVAKELYKELRLTVGYDKEDIRPPESLVGKIIQLISTDVTDIGLVKPKGVDEWLVKFNKELENAEDAEFTEIKPNGEH